MGNEHENEAASCQVDAFLSELGRRTGLSPTELSAIAQELLWMHKRRRRYETWGDWFARSVISVFVTAFFVGLAWGIVHFIQSIAHGR